MEVLETMLFGEDMRITYLNPTPIIKCKQMEPG